LRQLFKSVAVPHDQAFYNKRSGSNSDNIAPLAIFVGNNPSSTLKTPVRIRVFDNEWQPDRTYNANPDQLSRVVPYEDRAQELIDEFLNKSARLHETDKNYLSPKDRLATADMVLTSVERWHDSARVSKQREGDEWDKVRERLHNKRLKVLLLR